MLFPPGKTQKFSSMIYLKVAYDKGKVTWNIIEVTDDSKFLEEI